MERIDYRLAAQRWRALGSAVLVDHTGRQLLVLPIDFLQQGRVDNFGFVMHALQMTFHVEGGYIQ